MRLCSGRGSQAVVLVGALADGTWCQYGVPSGGPICTMDLAVGLRERISSWCFPEKTGTGGL